MIRAKVEVLGSMSSNCQTSYQRRYAHRRITTLPRRINENPGTSIRWHPDWQTLVDSGSKAGYRPTRHFACERARLILDQLNNRCQAKIADAAGPAINRRCRRGLKIGAH